jgi:F-box interacting protein
MDFNKSIGMSLPRTFNPYSGLECYQPFEFTGPLVANSCMGVIALYTSIAPFQISISNPITGKCALMPHGRDSDDMMNNDRWNRLRQVVGIGYEPTEQQFKIIRVVNMSASVQSAVAVIKVYTVNNTKNTENWRRVASKGIFWVAAFPAYMDGKIYFLVSYSEFPFSQPSYLRIRAFNLRSEEFEEVQLPLDAYDNEVVIQLGSITMGNLGQGLYLCKKVHADRVFKVWRFMDNNWSSMFDIPFFSYDPFCPSLFITPNWNGLYIVVVRGLRQFVTYNGVQIEGRFELSESGPREPCRFYWVQHNPSLVFPAVDNVVR